MGRKPKPTADKRIRGNPGKRPLNDREPAFRPGMPPMPECLRQYPVAVEVWDREGPELAQRGVLTVMDGAVFAHYCLLQAVAAKCADALAGCEIEYEKVTVDGSGQEHTERKVADVAKELRALTPQIRGCASDLGLTPSARSRIIAESQQDAPLDALLDAEPDRPLTAKTCH